jgi:hypothetical protein
MAEPDAPAGDGGTGGEQVVHLRLIKNELQSATEFTAAAAGVPPAPVIQRPRAAGVAAGSASGRRPAERAGGAAAAGGAPPDEGAKALPPDCPVTPLGRDGVIHYYLDTCGHLTDLRPKQHGRLELATLFEGHHQFLYDHFPRMKDGRVTGWRPEAIGEALLNTCAARGPWSPRDRCRGPGAWRGQGGELILHCGAKIVVVDEDRRRTLDPGILGEHVYPVGPPVPRPWERTVAAGPDGPAMRILGLARAWPWRRAALDPVLLLGWVGVAMLGGALDWRPVIWVTGGAGSGKSTLRDRLLAPLFGTQGVVSAVGTSAAGIWQRLKYACLPVIVDEIEAATGDDRRNQGVIELARVACSGGRVLRGGQEHEGVDFTIYSAFGFFSILIPALPGQDRSRIVALELGEIGDRLVPELRPDALAEAGLGLRTRLARHWGRLPARLAWYQASLRQAGLAARAADTYGVLLAAADVLLWDDPEDAGGEPEALVRAAAAEAETEREDGRDEDELLAFLLSSPLHPLPALRVSVAEALACAAGRRTSHDAVNCAT